MVRADKNVGSRIEESRRTITTKGILSRTVTLDTEEAEGSAKDCDASSPSAAVMMLSRGRSRATRRNSVSSTPPVFFPLPVDEHIRCKSVGRLGTPKKRVSLPAEAQLSPWAKVRPLKGRVLPIELELTELSEMELDEAPVKKGIVPAALVARQRACTKMIPDVTIVRSSGEVPEARSPVDHLAVATTGKLRAGRKPRPQGHPAQADSEDGLSHEIHIELVKDEDVEIVSGNPGVAVASSRRSLVDDGPPLESKPSRPRSGRKPRPSGAGVVRTAVPASQMPAPHDKMAGQVSRLPMRPVVSDKEPEWAKPKLKCTFKRDRTEEEKQVVWTKQPWSINRISDFELHHQSGDDPTEISESAAEPQE